MNRYLIIIAATFLILSCRSNSTNSGQSDSSVIDGLVLQGPISPVQRQGETNEAPLAGAPITIVNTGTYDAPFHLTSDANGHFSATVSPGTYAITPNSFPGQQLPRPMDPKA